MFADTDLNLPSTVLNTLYQNFLETAMKVYRYVKSFRSARQIDAPLIISTNPVPDPQVGA